MLEIRPFRKGFDEELFVGIFNACFGDYDDIRAMTIEEMKKIEESPAFSAEGIFIAEWNGEIAGMVNAYIDKLREERKGFIQSLGVLPRFRGKGTAKKLVEKALESLKMRGMEIAETWAQTDREACIHIFESFGFKKVRTTSMMKRNLENIIFNIGENMTVTIRDAKLTAEEDIKLLNRLDNETFKEHFNFRPRTIEETKYAILENPWFQRQKWFFALLGNQPVGYAGVGVDERLNEEKRVKWGWILDIGVLKPFRRKGIGKRLMLHGMQLLKSFGMKDALLYVDDLNPTNAIKLYESLGFEVLRKNIVYQLSL
ncbi:MAG: GNAT family N-acetyltransferase [Candidatus Bathyarchaeales archaeon]